MTYNFDSNLEAKTAKYYAEVEAWEPKERIAEDSYMVVYTYNDGYVSEVELSKEDIHNDYSNIEELKEDGLVKMEVFDIIEEYVGEEVVSTHTGNMVYSEKF